MMKMKYAIQIIIFAILPLSLQAENIVMPQNAELQWRICENNLDDTVKKLALTIKKTKQREVLLWDTSLGDLIENAWTVRVRHTSKGYSFSAKKNFYQPDFTPPIGSECEIDVKANKEKVGCSIKIKSDRLEVPNEILTVLKNENDISHYLNDAAFFGRAKSTNIEFSNSSEIELLEFKNYRRIEFSIRVKSADRFSAWKKWQEYLELKQIELCDDDLDLGARELLREFVAAD